jgi:hypothetical protein
MRYILSFILAILTTQALAKSNKEQRLMEYHQEINQELGLDEIDASYYGCYKDFEDRRKQLLKKSLLVGGLGVIALPVGAVVGMVTGSLVANIAGMGTGSAILASSTGLYVGVGAMIAGLTAYEIITLRRYVQAAQMQKLIVDASRKSNGKTLINFMQKLKKQNHKAQIFDVKKEIQTLDHSQALCDGSMVKRFEKLMNKGKEKRANKLKNRLANPKLLRASLQ